MFALKILILELTFLSSVPLEAVQGLISAPLRVEIAPREHNLTENRHERLLNSWQVMTSSLDFYRHPEDYRAENRVRFLCRKVNSSFVNLVKNHDRHMKQLIDFKYPVAILIHSYLGHNEKPWIQAMAYRFSTLAQTNACMMDWSMLANLELSLTLLKLRNVGTVAAEFIKSLEKYTSLSNVSIVGYGLGAHVAGIAGELLKGKIGKIFGLDPMLRFSEELLSNSNHLDRSDAQLVQICHTSNAVSGYRPGHQDFFFNNGKSPQPGCKKGTTSQEYDCSHFRAVELFYFSLDPAIEYTDEYNVDRFGFYTKGKSGLFYIETTNKQPFVLNKTDT